MSNDQEDYDFEVGEDNESTFVDKPTADESKAAAEIAVFLEDDIGVDLKRLYIRVRRGNIFIQGTVSTEEQLKEILELLPRKPGVFEFESQITVQPV